MSLAGTQILDSLPTASQGVHQPETVTKSRAGLELRQILIPMISTYLEAVQTLDKNHCLCFSQIKKGETQKGF